MSASDFGKGRLDKNRRTVHSREPHAMTEMSEAGVGYDRTEVLELLALLDLLDKTLGSKRPDHLRDSSRPPCPPWRMDSIDTSLHPRTGEVTT